MGFYYESEALDVLQQHEDGKGLPVQPDTSISTTIGKGLARGGLKLAKGALITSAALHENPDQRFEFIDKYIEPKLKAMTPDPASVSWAGEALGAISELPAQLLLGPVGMLNSVVINTGADMVDAGVSPGYATLAGIGTGIATAGMFGIPQAGKTIAKTVGLAALNPVMGAGTDLALKEGLEAAGYDKQADAIDPLNPASRAVDLIIGGVFGALGYRGHLITERAKTAAVDSNVKQMVQYRTLIDSLGGHEGIMDRLPVEVVDALTVAKDYQKRLESNPYDAGAKEWMGVHLDSLEKAISDIQETGKVDIGSILPDPRMDEDFTVPALRSDVSPEVATAHAEMAAHADDVMADLHIMGGSDGVIETGILKTEVEEIASTEPNAWEVAQNNLDAIRPSIMVGDISLASQNHIVMNARPMSGGTDVKIAAPYDGTEVDALRVAKALKLYASEDHSASMQQSEIFATDENSNPKYAFSHEVGETIIHPVTPAAESKPSSPLSQAIDNMFAERGDFTIYQGKDAAGNELHSSAQELVQTARDEMTRTQEMESVYQQAAVCLGLGT